MDTNKKEIRKTVETEVMRMSKKGIERRARIQIR